MLAVSPAYAQGPESDHLQAFGSAGGQIGFVNAFEDTEGGTHLFSFDSNYSDPLQLGHWIAILDSANGPISDVVGVASSDGTFAAGTNVFGFLSDGDGTGLTAAQIAHFFNQANPDATFIEAGNGIFIDVSRYLNQANSTSKGGSAFFFSDGAPDGGATVSLLGLALVGIQFLRRKFKTA